MHPRLSSVFHFISPGATMNRLLFTAAVFITCTSCGQALSEKKEAAPGKAAVAKADTIDHNNNMPAQPTDTATYFRLLGDMVNHDSSGKWPVKTGVPLPGSLLPYNRIVAFFGNLYCKKMGVLGEYPRKEMLAKLKEEIARWQAADTAVKVIPALHYIAVTAQGSPGMGNMYRFRMPFKQIDTVLSMAREINALVFLDVQVGHSTIQAELPLFEPYLKMPNVHFGMDPEFSMKGGQKPGAAIGTFDAADINFVSAYLGKIAKDNNIPPKILVVHRFTRAMVTNYKNIKLRPEVQVVMDMDGWGAQARKISTYKLFVYGEPVEYTGFKLFYKNDFREANSRIMTPAEVLKLKPRPMYIQYQ
jgi:hypothetical protein